jgi:hypothetical protein
VSRIVLAAEIERVGSLARRGPLLGPELQVVERLGRARQGIAGVGAALLRGLGDARAIAEASAVLLTAVPYRLDEVLRVVLLEEGLE